jgi:hypothetical protein
MTWDILFGTFSDVGPYLGRLVTWDVYLGRLVTWDE